MTTKNRSARPRKKPSVKRSAETASPCALCGNTERVTTTQCCGRPICDDEDKYVIFSYARNSCHRNHSWYTVCGGHHLAGHHGTWQACVECREDVETEIYVWWATNEYNFEKLEHPPPFRPTFCTKCHRRIQLGTDGYTMSGRKYWCDRCR